ncbi:MAG TPA: glycosyl hydrolase family 8 [Pseudacidobacterium sp.]|nr:glycosyl hydrolase family 8 [Pseudacidobacterium sp.]
MGNFLAIAAGLLSTTLVLNPIQAQTSDGKGAYATGHYRNLFAENGHSEKEIDAKINTAFEQLFHGDPDTQTVYYPAGKNANGPLAYLTDVANHDVRTEGMSYGMMITVQLNKKPEFDALWNWAKTYMYISDLNHPSYGYFSWSCKTDGTPNEETAAPDGEEYFVMSLYFAAARWGNGAGIYNYKQQADELLTTMRHRAVKSGPTRFGTRTVGNEVSEEAKMIRFVPGVDRGNFTDPSYHLPAFYELWARWGPVEDRQFWAQAAEASRSFFPKTANATTGLTPAYANFDGTPHTSRFPQSSIFGFDSWRTASNWSVDWSWWRKAPVEPELSDRIQKFFESQGLNSYGDVYALDGKVVEARHSTGLVATNAVASLAATDKKRSREFVEALWNTPIPSGHERYYDGMLYIMSLMHVSGHFRIWPLHGTDTLSAS